METMLWSNMKNAAFFCDNPDVIERVYADGRREKVRELTACYPTVITPANFSEHAAQLEKLEVIFSTWGMLQLSAEELECLPNLRAVFYAAGTVQGFARPFLKKEILVTCAAAANGIPVAEFTLAQILLANKGYFQDVAACSSAQGRVAARFSGTGNFGETVALLGVGVIGRKVIELLRPFDLRVIVFDPFLPDAEAERLGVIKVSLEEAFAQGFVVSNHLANLPATVGMLNGRLFDSMRQNATFINTGRGATVVESDLTRVLQARPDLTALLDVTDPEPPVSDSLFYALPNVHLTSHIAGSAGNEVVRMADYMIEEFKRWEQGEPLRYAVTLPMLERMA